MSTSPPQAATSLQTPALPAASIPGLAVSVPGMPAPTLGSVARRAAMGLGILLIVVTGAACLLYAAIDKDADGRDPASRDIETGSIRAPAPVLPRFITAPR